MFFARFPNIERTQFGHSRYQPLGGDFDDQMRISNPFNLTLFDGHGAVCAIRAVNIEDIHDNLPKWCCAKLLPMYYKLDHFATRSASSNFTDKSLETPS